NSYRIMHDSPAMAITSMAINFYGRILRQPPLPLLSWLAGASFSSTASGPGSSGACTSGMTGSGLGPALIGAGSELREGATLLAVRTARAGGGGAMASVPMIGAAIAPVRGTRHPKASIRPLTGETGSHRSET